MSKLLVVPFSAGLLALLVSCETPPSIPAPAAATSSADKTRKTATTTTTLAAQAPTAAWQPYGARQMVTNY